MIALFLELGSHLLVHAFILVLFASYKGTQILCRLVVRVGDDRLDRHWSLAFILFENDFAIELDVFALLGKTRELLLLV